MPSGTEYRKYGLTPDDACPRWYQIPISDGDGDRIIAMTLTDRGIGDDDANIPANGTIVGDSGPRLPMTKKDDGNGTSPACSYNPADWVDGDGS